MKKLFIVTISGSQPAVSRKWMAENHCVQAGDNAFLFYDEINLQDAQTKFLGLVSDAGRVNAFPVDFPFTYQNNQVFEDGLERIFGRR